MQVNRCIRGKPALDDVDHALGRPFHASGGYRNHYATSSPDQIAEMRASPWWIEGVTRGDMTFFHVSDAGRAALAKELADHATYGRVYALSRVGEIDERLVTAKSHSAAKYAAYVDADLDWPFMEFCRGLRVRLAS